ncbi:MAG: ribokinase [Anaerolineaceae bacterium]
MKNPKKIVVVGSINRDLVVRMPRIPKPGETILGGSFKTFAGGKGANQAVAAARLGANVVMIGGVGDDAFGSEMLDTLARENINIDYVKTYPEFATGVALIQVDEKGRNSIAVASGANFCLSEAHVEKSLHEIERFDVLLLQLEIPTRIVEKAAKIAFNQGAKVILNPSPAQILGEELLGLVDVLIPNEHEIGVMIREVRKYKLDFLKTIEINLPRKIKNLIVTLGDQGSIVINECGEETHVPAYSVQAIDTTAAGDCFVGALAVAICEGRSLVDAAKFASAAAALSVTREGAQPSLPNRDEVEEFLIEKEKYP